MFVKNIQKKDIEVRSFEGYRFSIPPGVSAVWDALGEHLLTNIYRKESQGGVDQYGFKNGDGRPPLEKATEKEWIKEGKKIASVERFQINAKLIPRVQLISIAQKRGISSERITEYLTNQDIDAQEIAQDINNIPVPDEIRYPVKVE